jgi:hypothetical protein
MSDIKGFAAVLGAIVVLVVFWGWIMRLIFA